MDDEHDFEMVDGSSISSYELVEEPDAVLSAKLEAQEPKWETELIPDELKPMARTLYLIYAMCKKYPQLNQVKDTLKDMWCDGDQRLMTAVSFIEKGQIEQCASQLLKDATVYNKSRMVQEPCSEQGLEKIQKHQPLISNELQDMRAIFGLSTKPLKELIQYVFYNAEESGGSFNRSQFFEVIGRIIDTHSISQAKFHGLLDRLFDALDSKGEGRIDPHSLSIAASLLCHGTSEEKTQVAFLLFDLDKSKTITEDEMRGYYSVVFHVLFEVCARHNICA